MTIPSDLAEWIATETAGNQIQLSRRAGGARHGAWDVTAAFTDGTSRHYFLRADSNPAPPWEYYTLRREATIYAALHRAGLPVPAVIGVHPTCDAVLLERMTGTSSLRGLAAVHQQGILDDLIAILAQLHCIDPSSLDLPAEFHVKGVGDHVIDELGRWEQRLNSTGQADPLARVGLKWLRHHIPPTRGSPAMVQGDAGPGNFLHDSSTVTALLDFELAHLGDPVEDIAWIAVRSIQDPIPDFEGLVRKYEAATGDVVDEHVLRYHILFAILRIVILDLEHRTATVEKDADQGLLLIFGATYRRLLAEMLFMTAGRSIPAVITSEAPTTAETAYYDAVLCQLQDIVLPSITDDFALGRAKSLARMVKILRERDRQGTKAADAELCDLTQLLGGRPDSLPQGRAELEQRIIWSTVDPEATLDFLWRRIEDEHSQLTSALGTLSERHLPNIGTASARPGVAPTPPWDGL